MNNTTNTKEGTDGQIRRKNKRTLKTCFQNSFLLMGTFDVMLSRTYLFNAKLCFCHLQVNSSLTSSPFVNKDAFFGNIDLARN